MITVIFILIYLTSKVLSNVFLNNNFEMQARLSSFGTIFVGNITSFYSVAGSPPINSYSDGCKLYALGTEFNGQIALIERGNCSFVNKVYYAQRAGAISVIVFDNVINASLFSMNPDVNSEFVSYIEIPSFFISRSDGLRLRNEYLQYLENSTITTRPSLALNVSELDLQGFPKQNYSTLGILFGILLGISVPYWLLFFVWRRHQYYKKDRALKALKKRKYEATEIAALPPPEVIVPNNEGSSQLNVPPGEDVELQVLPTTAAEMPNNQDSIVLDVSTSQETDNMKPVVLTHDGEDKATLDEKINEEGNKNDNNKKKKKKSKWKRKSQNSNIGPIYDNGTCSVCLEEFETGEDILILPCRHIYHEACVRNWMETHGTCPFCKARLFPEGAATERSNNGWSREGCGILFGINMTQTFVLWLIFISFIMVLAYFLVASGLLT